MKWLQLSLTLAIILAYSGPSFGQVCTWRWLEPSLANLTRTVGASGKLIVEVDDELIDGTPILWIWNSKTVASYSYSDSTSEFDAVMSFSRGTSSASRNGSLSLYFLNISSLTIADDGTPIQVRSGGCSSDSPERRLVVKNCDKQIFNPFASPSNASTDCGFNCHEQFTCNKNECLTGTFQGVCQADATWSPSVHQCPTSTCDADSLPSFMQFVNGSTNIACGAEVEVQCTGDSSLFCGSTRGTCTTDNSIMLSDPVFNCTSVCSVKKFSHAETLSPNPRCGASASFTCRLDSSCESTSFTRICGRGGKWDTLAHPCKRNCQTAVTWAIVFGVAFALLWAFHLTRVLIQCCDDNCCCFSGGKCCKLEGGDGDPPCVSVLLSPVLKIAGCLERCKCCCKSFFWTAYAVYSSILSLILIIAALVLLVLSKSGCCDSATMISGIIVGFIALAVLIAFIVPTFLGCTAILAAVQLKKRVSPGSASGAAGKPEAVQLTENSNEAVA